MAKSKPVPKKFKKLVREAFTRHAWNIGVSHYTGEILYMKESAQEDEDERITRASIVVDRRYLTATLKIYPNLVENWIKDRDDEVVDQVVAHEVGHLATDHLYCMAISIYKDEGETKDAWETLTTIIGNLSIKIDKLEKKK